MMHRMLFAVLLSVVCVAFVLNAGSSQCVAAEPAAATVGLADFSQLPLLAQAGNEDSGSGTRVRGRSIRGLISLAILVIGGIGWVFKKMFGGDQ